MKTGPGEVFDVNAAGYTLKVTYPVPLNLTQLLATLEDAKYKAIQNWPDEAERAEALETIAEEYRRAERRMRNDILGVPPTCDGTPPPDGWIGS